MKKLTKLVSAVAFASALVLVGCANPSSGGVPTIETIKASDVKVPDGFKPSSTAKKVETKVQINEVLDKIMPEYRYLLVTAQDAVMEKMNSDPKNKTNVANIMAYNEKVDALAKANKDGDVSIDFTIASNSYTLKEKIATGDVVYGTISGKAIYKKSENKLTDNMKINMIGKVDIKDAAKFEVYDENSGALIPINNIKSMVASSSISSDTTKVTIKDKINYSYTDTEIAKSAIVFDTGDYYGIAEIAYKVTETATDGKEEIEITFYDLDGNKTADTLTIPEI